MIGNLIVFLCAAGLAVPATLAAMRLAGRIGAVDQPGLRKVHSRPMPRTGGLGILIPTIVVLAAGLLVKREMGQSLAGNLPGAVALLGGAVVLFAVGLVDDIRGLRARHKLLAQLVCAAGLCACGVRIELLAAEGLFYISMGWLSWPVTILWVVGVTNAMNLIDGLDGLASGIAAIACAVIAIFCLCTGQALMAMLMFSLLGSLCGFLLFGFNPARIFLGDCGSLFIGYLLAGGSVLSSTKTMTAVGMALPLLAMGVPIFDTLFCMIRRALERRSPFSPDRGHIHHRLLAMGLRHRHVVLMLYGMTLLSAGLGMFMMVTRNAGTLLVFLGVLTLLGLAFYGLGAVPVRDAIGKLRRNLAISRACKSNREAFEHGQLMLREARNAGQPWDALCHTAGRLGVRALRLVRGGQVVCSWRHQEHGLSCAAAVHVSFPCDCTVQAGSAAFEIDIDASGGLELAGHRAAVFGRLAEQCHLAETQELLVKQAA